ncbi:hypothetical protein N657DRAFT_676305 [Parathielavia appendiculata]|uniref:Uncharacterized protein n=1 Tax=Parathielavia appendiculata TaxID=2587402 RepID=A0AAN6U8Q2_9PEZI|nr:hypothetical protein N657DRAFT_676305 [Parathielavia appendiculata]
MNYDVRELLQQAFNDVDPGHATAFDLMGGNEIRAWIEDLTEVEQANKGFEILSGVAGATGTGKTSRLNALLEYPELLASSSTDAATATVCRTAWNRDDAEGHEFRADVKFRTKEAVVKALNKILTAVKDRKEPSEQEFESEDERIEAIEELTDVISRGINKICAVWALDEGEIEDMEYIVESVTADNEQIVGLLGTGIAVYSSDTDEFAAEVKSYLDSTLTPEGIPAWPLIEGIRIDVKSEILKHGIILVEDRSAMVEHYYQKLSVTAIVTPAIRAVDLKTGVKLMGNYQELRMQLNGKYHKDNICVVISKIDDMEVDVFCKDDAAQLDRSLSTLESRRKLRCVGIRNQYIKKRIPADIFHRQKKLVGLAEHNRDKYDRSAEVFPVCASGFSDLLKGKKPQPGFPSKLYTGVPRLRQWPREAILAYREEHCDMVLRELQRLHDGIRTWSDDRSRGMVRFSRREIESLLQSSHKRYLKRITVDLIRSVDGIKKSSPLRNMAEKLATCKPLEVNAVSRWAYKYPDDTNSTKMAWVTYQAILKKYGRPFQSNGAGRPFYDFSLAHGTPFLDRLREDRLQFFQVELSKAEEPLVEETAEVWAKKSHRHSPVLEATNKSLDDIWMELSARIMAFIKAISEGASQIHPLFIDSLRTGLVPHFIQALRIKGRNHFELRQSHLRTALQAHNPQLVSEGYMAMEKVYDTRTHPLPSVFLTASKSAVNKVKTQISLLLNDLHAHVSVGRDRTALDKKVRLQKAVKVRVLGNGKGEGRSDIQAEFVEVVMEDDGKIEGAGEEGEESELDSDTEDDDEEMNE